ncbi:MAG TPA: cupin domain-containing protein [Streptosporangiaceae bacterium]|jgi:quercetin dioxygenase-like cupin family protein
MSDAAQPADRPAADPAAGAPGPDGSLGDAGSHFTTQADGEPAGPGRFVNVDELPVVEFLPGLGFRPVLGQRAMTNFVSFAPGATAPHHVHEEEQIVIVLDGEMTFDLDGDVRTMRKGDVAVIPSWVPHGAWTADSHCLEVDVFCPPRQSLLKLAEAHAAGSVEAAVLNDAAAEAPGAEATEHDVVEASGVDTAGAPTAAGGPASEA